MLLICPLPTSFSLPLPFILLPSPLLDGGPGFKRKGLRHSFFSPVLIMLHLWYYFFLESFSVSLEIIWPPGPSRSSPRRLGLVLAFTKRNGEWGGGEAGRVSTPFPVSLELYCIQSSCSVSNINETGFYNHLKGNFMRRNRKTLKFIIYRLENKFVIVLLFLPDIKSGSCKYQKSWGIWLCTL